MKLLIPLVATSLLALATDPPISGLSNLTATAILGWYAWQTATRTVPQLVADFRAELAAARDDHRHDRDAFFAEMSQERTTRHSDNAAAIQSLQDLTTAITNLTRTGAKSQI
jgi:hypothetical protein